MSRIVIGTRGSQLARTQTNWVADQLKQHQPDLEVVIEIIKTTGDKITDVPLARIGGKGLFTKELEIALMDGTIDVAVHSLKDLPTVLPEGLMLGAVPEREIPFDALVCGQWKTLEQIPDGATVGTSSLRRRAQLTALRPDLEIVDLRGNIDTRISKVLDGDLDAAILACAGMKRLGREDAIREPLKLEHMVPAVSQGALALETRIDDERVAKLLEPIRNDVAERETTAERTLLARLEGGCQVPMGALARVDGDGMTLTACVASLDGSELLRCVVSGTDAVALGNEAADDLLEQGAADIIAACR